MIMYPLLINYLILSSCHKLYCPATCFTVDWIYLVVVHLCILDLAAFSLSLSFVLPGIFLPIFPACSGLFFPKNFFHLTSHRAQWEVSSSVSFLFSCLLLGTLGYLSMYMYLIAPWM